MSVKGIKSEIYKNYKQIRKLIEQHDRVRIVFGETNLNPDIEPAEYNLRRRIITKDGLSKVSYKGTGYKKWSGYSRSCFISSANVKDFKQTLKLMRNHDGTWLKPIEVHYDWFFTKKVKL